MVLRVLTYLWTTHAKLCLNASKLTPPHAVLTSHGRSTVFDRLGPYGTGPYPGTVLAGNNRVRATHRASKEP